MEQIIIFFLIVGVPIITTITSVIVANRNPNNAWYDVAMVGVFFFPLSLLTSMLIVMWLALVVELAS